ncbi:MAG: hypothetical protein AABY54_04075 [Deltaproteobacteria bacterium]
MITINNLPKSYIPYDTLVVCSNTLIGGVNVVAIGEVLPLLIGKGDKPRIWLQAIAKPDSSDFVTIVEESISTHPAVKIYEENNVIKVEASGTLVLTVKLTGENSAEVEILDFRPLGLNMHGTKGSLTVGGSTFSQNTMSGGKVFIGFGK